MGYIACYEVIDNGKTSEARFRVEGNNKMEAEMAAEENIPVIIGLLHEDGAPDVSVELVGIERSCPRSSGVFIDSIGEITRKVLSG